MGEGSRGKCIHEKDESKSPGCSMIECPHFLFATYFVRGIFYFFDRKMDFDLKTKKQLVEIDENSVKLM